MMRTSWLTPGLAAVSTGLAGMTAFLDGGVVTLIAPGLRVSAGIAGVGPRRAWRRRFAAHLS
jgi:hypothetical protein